MFERINAVELCQLEYQKDSDEKFDECLDENLQDEEFRKEFEKIKPEMDAIREQVSNVAYLSNIDNYTIFEFREHTIRFKTSSQLERYTEIKEWEHGYLVVMAKYEGNAEPEEEYIDLIPILENLYFDVDEFLKPIEKVILHQL